MFLGRELAERTTYVRDDDGLVVEAVTVRESAWTDDDRAWAIALLEEQREVCSGCGQPLAVCMDRGTEYTWSVVRHTCQACLVMEAEQENDAEAARDRPGARARGRKYAVIRDISAS